MARPKVDGIGAELDRPFNDAAAGFLVSEDIAELVCNTLVLSIAFDTCIS